MRIAGWRRENGLAYQSLVNEISAEEMRGREISQNSCLALAMPQCPRIAHRTLALRASGAVGSRWQPVSDSSDRLE